VVGRFTVQFPPYLDLTHRIDVDEQTGGVRRNEVYLTGTYGRSSVQVSYVQLAPSAITLGLDSREEINTQLDLNFYRNWEAFGALRRDLIAGDDAYPVADNGVLNSLTSTPVGTNATEGPWVSSAWLNAFTRGTPLQFPTLNGLGNPLSTTLPPQPGTHVGDFGKLNTPNGTVGYIETETGLVAVNFFVYSLYSGNPQITESSAKEISLTASQVNLAQAVVVGTADHMSVGKGVGRHVIIVPTIYNVDRIITTRFTGTLDHEELTVGFIFHYPGKHSCIIVNLAVETQHQGRCNGAFVARGLGGSGAAQAGRRLHAAGTARWRHRAARRRDGGGRCRGRGSALASLPDAGL